MPKRTRAALFALLATSLLATGAARAEDSEYTKDTWPLEATLRPLTLAGGMLELRGDTFRFNLSKDMVGDPLSLAPDVYYGVDDKLTVGVAHDTGICLSGDSCGNTYNDVTVDALYGLMLRGSFQLAAHGGIAVPRIDPDFMIGMNVGFLGRINAGNLAIVFDPRLYIGFTERDNGGKELVAIPIWLQFQINQQTMAYVSGGFVGPLDGFADNFAVPIGVGALFAVNNRLDFGGELLFDNLAGHGHSADGRWLILRAALRL